MNATPSISIIIVTYRSEKVLGYCLKSIESQTRRDFEVILIDNNSEDDSVELASRYNVQIIPNKKNEGFARACHQGAKAARGELLLFLNPDTILAPETLHCIMEEVENGKDVGAVSPILISGSGEVLQETARHLPTPVGALQHILKLSSGSYYQEIKNAVNEGIEIACGACLAVRKDVWVETGGFDTRYFMYAEDVDLSYQIRKHGYRIALLNDAYVIHLKGESTDKKGWSYNRHFYNSMNLFVHKYHGELYSYTQSALSSFFTITLTIVSFILQVLKQMMWPLIHISLFVGSLFLVQEFWARYFHGDSGYYDGITTSWTYLIYGILWVAGIFFQGGYLNSHKRYAYQFTGFLIGWVVSLIVYSLFPEEMRFSRAILIIGGIFWLFIFWVLSMWNSSRAKKISIHLVTDKDLAGNRQVSDDFPLVDIKAWGDFQENTDEDVIPVFDIDKNAEHFSLPHYLYQYKSKNTGFWDSQNQKILLAGLPGLQSIETNRHSHHNLSNERYLFQKSMLDNLVVALLCPIALLFKGRKSRTVLSKTRRVLFGEMTLIGLPKREDLTKTVSSVVTIDRLVESNTVYDPYLSYSVHYTIFDDVKYIVTNLQTIIAGLAEDYD